MSQRRQRREAERLQNKIKEKLTFLTERFVSNYMTDMLSTNPHAISKTFDILDKEWREFAGKTIKSNPKIYSYPKRKENIRYGYPMVPRSHAPDTPGHCGACQRN